MCHASDALRAAASLGADDTGWRARLRARRAPRRTDAAHRVVLLGTAGGANPKSTRSGYSNAVTCGRRGSWQPFELRREGLHTPDGALTFALKSRGHYYGVRDVPPARLARWATRSFRHRAERR